jgi:hypothetical protein
MDFGDAKPQIVPRFGSAVFWDNETQLPLGLARDVTNCRYRAQSIATRWGFDVRLRFGIQGSRLTGLQNIRYLAPSNNGDEIIKLLGYTAVDGNIYSATPFQQPSVTQLTTDAALANMNLPRIANLNPRIIQAFNKGIVAQGNLAQGIGNPMIYDPEQGTIDPVSDKPVGTPWTPLTRFRVGQMVSPSEFITNGLPAIQGVWHPLITGHLYRVTSYTGTGQTGSAQPGWPITPGAIVVSGDITFTEDTPTAGAGLPDPFAPLFVAEPSDAGSPIIDGAWVYVVLTYVSAVGESTNDLTDTNGQLDHSKVFVYHNQTGGPVDLTMVTPPIPAALGTGGPYGAAGATGYNAYAYIIQTGLPDQSKIIDPTYYAQYAASIAGATNFTLNAYPTGPALPAVNTANISGEGNVDPGLRYMVVIFETRTAYQTGFTRSAPIPVDISNSGRRIRVPNLPIGPYNCTARICGFTVAGASAAGPYAYVAQDDVESPGFNQPDIPITSTRINDNTTTNIEFNITDSYLPGATDITSYLQRVEVTDASDVYFSKSLLRVVYTGMEGFPSAFIVSDVQDPEAIRIPGSNLPVAEADGDRCVCFREFRENQLALKENSGYAIVPNDGDPSTWATNRLWGGSGPTGSKAVAVGLDNDNQTEFLAYAHRSGAFRFTGGQPQLINRELIGTQDQPGWWDRINWTYGYLIQVTIDEKRRELRFAVPFDGSQTRNKVLTCNYQYGWEEPVVFAVRQGRMIPNLNGRKWSLDDVTAEETCYVPRRYDPDGSQVNVALTEELMVGGPDGALRTLKEGQYFDDAYDGITKVGYMSKWDGVVGPGASLALYQLEGASCSAIGHGPINVYARDDQGVYYPLSTPQRTWTLTTTESQRDFGVVGIEERCFGIGFDNGGIADNWFEMHVANLWLTPTFQTRTG